MPVASRREHAALVLCRAHAASERSTPCTLCIVRSAVTLVSLNGLKLLPYLLRLAAPEGVYYFLNISWVSTKARKYLLFVKTLIHLYMKHKSRKLISVARYTPSCR